MNAHEFLIQQHNDVENLHTEFQAATGERKKELGKEILTALTVHAEIEEELYYPEVEKAGMKELSDEYKAEHAAMKTLILRLTPMDHEDEEYEPTMKALMEAVLHHAEEEETQGMQKVEAIVNPDILSELGPKLEARSRELKESTMKRLWAIVT